MAAELTFEIIQHFGVLTTEDKRKKKELNIVKWGNNEPKFDIRAWDESHTKPDKGITLSAEEIQNLKDLLNSIS